MMRDTGRCTVPQIFIGDTHVGGCDDLIALDQRGALVPLLAGHGRPDNPARDSSPPRAALAAGFLPTRDSPWPTTTSNPVFQIQRIYLKDLSLEQPNSPQILLEQAPAAGRDQPRRGRRAVGDGDLRGHRHRDGDDQGQRQGAVPGRGQAGRHLRDPQHPATSSCSRSSASPARGIVYPYLRAIVSDVCTRAGFPPVLLSEVNFQAMFEAQQAQPPRQRPTGANGSAVITRA